MHRYSSIHRLHTDDLHTILPKRQHELGHGPAIPIVPTDTITITICTTIWHQERIYACPGHTINPQASQTPAFSSLLEHPSPAQPPAPRPQHSTMNRTTPQAPPQ